MKENFNDVLLKQISKDSCKYWKRAFTITLYVAQFLFAYAAIITIYFIQSKCK